MFGATFTPQAGISGTYTPVFTAVTNVSSFVATAVKYLRIGNVVILLGLLQVTFTTSGVTSTLRMSIPFPSTFSGGTQDADGNATNPGNSPGSGIPGGAANTIDWIIVAPNAGTSDFYRFVAGYIID